MSESFPSFAAVADGASDRVMCCPIPNNDEKLAKGSAGMRCSGTLRRDCGNADPEDAVDDACGFDGPSQRDKTSDTDSLPAPSASVTVHSTFSERINGTELW